MDPAGDWDPTTAQAYIDSQIASEAATRLAQDTYLGNEINTIKKNKIYLTGSTLSQSQINQINTIYVIKDDLTLTENITVPTNCILEFDGGTINCYGYSFALSSTLCREARMSWFESGNNDSEILQNLANSYNTVIIDRDVVLNGQTVINKVDKCEIVGDGKSVIKFTNQGTLYPVVIEASESLKIDNIIVDFEQLQHPPVDVTTSSNIYFRIKNANKFVELSNIFVKDYWKTGSAGNQDAFYIFWVDHLSNTVNIHDCRFENIFCVGDDIQITTNAGVGRCIMVYGSKGNTETDKPNIISSGSCTINNMYFKNCYGVSAADGSAELDDFDCIHILLEPFNSASVSRLDPNSPNLGLSCTVSNCEFHNVSKRAIKYQASNGKISNILFENSGEIKFNCVIQTYGSNNELDKITAYLYDASCYAVVSLGGPNSSISNSVIRRMYYRTAFSTYGVELHPGCVIDNCIINNISVPLVVNGHYSFNYGLNYENSCFNVVVKNSKFPKLSSTASNTKDCIDFNLNQYEASVKIIFENCCFTDHIFSTTNKLVAEFNNCSFHISSTVQSYNYVFIGDRTAASALNRLAFNNCGLLISRTSSVRHFIDFKFYMLDIIAMTYDFVDTAPEDYQFVLVSDSGSAGSNITLKNIFPINNIKLDHLLFVNIAGPGSKAANHNYIIDNCDALTGLFNNQVINGKANITRFVGTVAIRYESNDFTIISDCIDDLNLTGFAESCLKIGSFKMDNGVPKWWNGTAWVDATGTPV